VAGGAVVIALGWHLMHYERPEAEVAPDPHVARQAAVARAFHPLTLPVSIDAGVIAVAITLGANHGQTLERDIIQVAAAIIGSAIVAGALLLTYRHAMRVVHWLGSRGMEMFLRLSALIVLSIGVQIVCCRMPSSAATRRAEVGSCGSLRLGRDEECRSGSVRRLWQNGSNSVLRLWARYLC
jgi:multiple antibiotic resistance protein